MQETGLYVVATPIGNLEDISARALRVLVEVDCIAAEDTRRTGTLLQHFGIRTRLQALHDHNESQATPALLKALLDGRSLALVSDAGTPLISDPGYRLVRSALEQGVAVFTVPGPSAVTAALSIAGLPTDRFVFEGFLPARAAARRRRLEELRPERRTLVFFESSHRIRDCLADLVQVFGPERTGVIARELTKQFETVLRGAVVDLQAQLEADHNQRKGEFVVLVGGAPEIAESSLAEALAAARSLLEFLPSSQAARAAAKLTGRSRREIFAALDES